MPPPWSLPWCSPSPTDSGERLSLSWLPESCYFYHILVTPGFILLYFLVPVFSYVEVKGAFRASLSSILFCSLQFLPYRCVVIMPMHNWIHLILFSKLNTGIVHELIIWTIQYYCTPSMIDFFPSLLLLFFFLPLPLLPPSFPPSVPDWLSTWLESCLLGRNCGWSKSPCPLVFAEITGFVSKHGLWAQKPLLNVPISLQPRAAESGVLGIECGNLHFKYASLWFSYTIEFLWPLL